MSWYEISFVIGPCSEEQAIEVAHSISNGGLPGLKEVWMDELKVAKSGGPNVSVFRVEDRP
jgi:hypothetical protein